MAEVEVAQINLAVTEMCSAGAPLAVTRLLLLWQRKLWGQRVTSLAFHLHHSARGAVAGAAAGRLAFRAWWYYQASLAVFYRCFQLRWEALR